MKFDFGIVVFVKDHPEIDFNTEAVEVVKVNIKDKTYTVHKTADTNKPKKLYVVKEENVISPLQWIDSKQLFG